MISVYLLPNWQYVNADTLTKKVAGEFQLVVTFLSKYICPSTVSSYTLWSVRTPETGCHSAHLHHCVKNTSNGKNRSFTAYNCTACYLDVKEKI